MSGELRAATAPGSIVYSHVLNKSSRLWNGAAFEAYASGNYPNYTTLLVAQGSSGVYVGDFPVTITDEGSYECIHYAQLGGAPAEGDPIVGTSVIKWNGSSVSATEDIAAGEMSGSEWEAYVLRSFIRTDKSDEIFEATNACIAEIRRKFVTQRDEVETTITDTIAAIGDYKLDLEADFGMMVSDVFIRDSGQGRFLTRITKAQFDRKYSIWGNEAPERNLPREYCVFGGQVLIGPIPDNINYVYVISYSKANTLPVTSLSSSIPYTTEDYKEILRNGALFRLYKLVENDDQAAAYKALWDDGINQIDTRERRNRQGVVAVQYRDI